MARGVSPPERLRPVVPPRAADGTLSEPVLRPLVEKIVRDVSAELNRKHSKRLAALVGPSAERWGYAFGADGVVSAEETMRMLAITTSRTLRNHQARGYIRLGHR